MIATDYTDNKLLGRIIGMEMISIFKTISEISGKFLTEWKQISHKIKIQPGA